MIWSKTEWNSLYNKCGICLAHFSRVCKDILSMARMPLSWMNYMDINTLHIRFFSLYLIKHWFVRWVFVKNESKLHSLFSANGSNLMTLINIRQISLKLSFAYIENCTCIIFQTTENIQKIIIIKMIRLVSNRAWWPSDLRQQQFQIQERILTRLDPGSNAIHANSYNVGSRLQ